jgi:hypothetical protein
MTQLEPLVANPRLEQALEHHKAQKNILLETFAMPNGVISGSMPEGVAQHPLLRPHFAVDRPIKFADIKAGDDGIWFQAIRPDVRYYDGDEQPHVTMPLGRIVSIEEVKNHEGKPSDTWKVSLEAPYFDEDHSDWERDEFEAGEIRKGERYRMFSEVHVQAYQRHVWLPLGWGTPEGYPTTFAAEAALVVEGDILKRIMPGTESIVDDAKRSKLSSHIVTVDEDWLNVRKTRTEVHDFSSALFKLHPPISQENYEGQGERIPDMPNQQGDAPDKGEKGEAGEGEGSGEAEEIPPMPGEPGYGGSASANAKLEHLKQAGWWGSQTG